MARPRAFDSDETLRTVMHVFRRQGYAATSVSDLTAATGLSTSSLYGGFGDKAALFRAALDAYVVEVVEARLDAHAGPEARLEDLEQLLLGLFELPYADGHGCLVVNTATELGSQHPVAGAGVRRGLGLVEERFRAVLTRELGHDRDAAGLMLLYEGLLGLMRAGLETPEHAEAIRTHLRTLTTRRDHRRDTHTTHEEQP
ncbi:TetR/AcrR family transcriptional regulator [Nocardioides aequoreus]|uniref:TetR/AcrR family transcriptional regulator n=1 Tax=Nocardioides aequoreus TaxID=397278 RepID=UPI00068E9AD4|nr:TetR/AcrR family transcriptional regulator [Nocardioides aequoreus]